MIRSIRWIAAVAILAGVAGQATLGAESVGGPVSGILFDERKLEIRPVLGLPGAAVVGAPINLGFEIEAGTVYSQGAYGIFATGGTSRRLVFVDGLLGDAAGLRVVEIEANAFPIDQVVFNHEGTCALAVGHASVSLKVISGLPLEPRVAVTLDPSKWPGEVVRVALSANCEHALATISRELTPDRQDLYEIDMGNQEPRFIGSFGQVTALQYVSARNWIVRRTANRSTDRRSAGPGVADGADRESAVIAELGREQVTLVKNLQDSPRFEVIPTPAGVLRGQVSVALVAGDGELLIAGSLSDSILVYNLSSGDFEQIAVPRRPARLEALDRQGTVLFTEPDSSTQYVISPGAEHRVYFIPSTK